MRNVFKPMCLAIVAGVISGIAVRAEEGMWLFTDPPTPLARCG